MGNPFVSLKNPGYVAEAERWTEFYFEKMLYPATYIKHLETHYAPYFLAIMDEALRLYVRQAPQQQQHRTHLVELGCRPGFVMAVLHEVLTSGGWRRTLNDRYEDSDLLYEVRQTSGVGRRRGDPLCGEIPASPAVCGLLEDTYEVDDIFSLVSLDSLWDQVNSYIRPIPGYVFHSFGLLEHYPMSSSVLLVNYWRRRGVGQVHYVPLIGHGTPSFGDERLLDKWEWINTLSPSTWQTFNDEKDLVMTFRGQPQGGSPVWEVDQN